MNSLLIVDCLLVSFRLNQLDIYNMHFKQKLSNKNYFYHVKNNLTNINVGCLCWGGSRWSGMVDMIFTYKHHTNTRYSFCDSISGSILVKLLSLRIDGEF